MLDRLLSLLVAFSLAFLVWLYARSRDPETARLTFRSSERIYEVTGLPIQFLCPADFALRPEFTDGRFGKVSLHVRGPASKGPQGLIVFLDLTDVRFKTGVYTNERLRVELPKGF